MSESNPQYRREDCRREVRRYLAERQALAFPAVQIRRKLRIDGNDFSEEEIVAALAFLTALAEPHVRELHDPDGATRYYKATSAGVLANERLG